MILARDFEDFITLLNKHQVAYMIVGGYALAFHGKPRHTGDLDIWINISEENAVKMLKALKDFGMGTLGFKKEDFLKPGYVTQIGYPPLRIDILNNIDGLEFEEARQNMQQMDANGVVINYIGLRDFLKNKQASGRIQDIADIREIKKKAKNGQVKPKKKRTGR